MVVAEKAGMALTGTETGHNSDGRRNSKHILMYARQILGMCLLVLNVAVEVVTVTMVN